MNRPKTSRVTTLLGTASLLTMAQAEGVHGAEAVAQAEEIPETVLITGSLIRGTTAVGVPVINLSPQDFAMTGTVTAADLFRSIPQFNVAPGPVGTQGANEERGVRVNLRQLDTGSAPRSLMMIDGLRYPQQSADLCQIDPSIIPTSAIERIDLLLDGASATYGSDAIGGVINIILKRNFDGAFVEAGFKMGDGGNLQYLASATWGRTWDGGQVTLSYSWFDISPTHGNFNSKLTFDHRPWGLDDRRAIGSSTPGTISTGAQIGLSMPDPDNPGMQIPNPNYPGNLGTNCQNCYAIPLGTGFDWDAGASGLGPLLPGSAPTIDWTTLSDPGNAGPNGTRNVFNPYAITHYSAAVQYTGGALTVDQRLTRNISFYGSGLYGMRRTRINVDDTGHRITYAVPTFNPYYPANAPQNLRVAYHMGIESPAIAMAYSLAQRYQLGLNIALPANWAMQVYFSHTKDTNHSTPDEDGSRNNVMQASVSAALGWTIPGTPAAGTAPAIATWTKPANIPYLNLFCDPRAYQCNSPDTLKYLYGVNETHEYMHIRERGIKADGPLFDLPGGPVKMAVGGNYITYNFLVQQTLSSQTSPIVDIISDPRTRHVWAAYTQLNIPIFSDQNALPLLRRLELEASWRHDQYDDVGGTSNAKLAFNWNPIEALTIRGGWGQSFRAPNFGEFSPIASVTWDGWNLGDLYPQNTVPITISCTGGAPPAGSGADKLFQAGFGCGSALGGLSIGTGGRVPSDSGLRDYFNIEQKVLDPEKAVNWAIGFDFTPTRFLTGLNIQATYYIVKINGVLRNFGMPDSRFSDPSYGFVFTTPEDLRDPITDAQLCAGQNATPWLCAPFQDIVTRSLNHSANQVPETARTLIYWINDGGTMNSGWQTTKGIDFQWSYDWEWEGIGAFNTGMIGTYYLSQNTQVTFGEPILNFYHTDLASVNGVEQNGVESRPRFKYRARLGWSDGTWSLTGFMDYEQHFFHIQRAPPNVNFACITPGGTVGGRPAYDNPCLISDYTNHQPSYYTFDLSLGYSTGDRPANEYLRNVNVQMVVQNITDRDSPYMYKINTSGGLPCACDVFKSLFGRMISLRVQKAF